MQEALLPLPSLSAFFFSPFNLIFWADIVNLKFSNMLDSDSEESQVHFWKWLYANKSFCRSLKQGICWSVRVVPLFLVFFRNEAHNVPQGSFCLILKSSCVLMSIFVSLGVWSESVSWVESGGFQKADLPNLPCNLFRPDLLISGNEVLGRLLILVNCLGFNFIFKKALAPW